jgi:hypothetical protein
MRATVREAVRPATRAGLVLKVRRALRVGDRVRFYVLNKGIPELARQRDVAKFGFFVEARDALDVLKLIARRVEADNRKLAKYEAKSVALRSSNR